MTKKQLVLPKKLDNTTFLSKKAGSFSHVPQRTVQAWTEAGLIVGKTKGTGDRRRYSVFGCIEIGIVKSLARERFDSRITREIMQFLRKYKPSNLERILAEEQGYLVVRLHSTGRITPHIYGHAKAKESNRSLLKYWRLISMPADCQKTLIVNITRIAKQVLSNIKTSDYL